VALRNGAEAVALARQLRPGVCLVDIDIRMPMLDGVEVTRALAGPGASSPLRIVIVTTFDLDDYVYGALRVGASASCSRTPVLPCSPRRSAPRTPATP
jgi:DNA-binding NarL/FixJ family response regulator